ncbi:hypothetical protein FRB93_004488 [Tulasnella sp. JGI-2019a]|nr:hypothetical protein FRB93_004488 [Tulasnella sp. JGI-2019a]
MRNCLFLTSALFLRMFSSSIWPLWKQRHRIGGKFVVAITLCLFVTATSHIVINIVEGYDRFVTYRASPAVVGYSEKGYLLEATINGLGEVLYQGDPRFGSCH